MNADDIAADTFADLDAAIALVVTTVAFLSGLVVVAIAAATRRWWRP